MAPTTPKKSGNSSPGKFIRPADLFNMRRNSTKTITLTPQNNSNSSNPGANISFHLHSSPLGGFNQPKPPAPSSPSFKRISAAHHVEPPSPLKCLSNLADPSPTKNLPTILKNPFDKPVKRRLQLSPKKAIKRTKMLALDEDANLEAPKTKPYDSPTKGKNCSINDWTLKTKLKVRFDSFCKNWNEKPSTTHRRFQESTADNSISMESIKNLATVYQHPYLAWLPLFPRATDFTKSDATSSVNFRNNTQITNMILNDWCESLDDLTNLLIEGRCPYFYLCAEDYNVLFKHKPGSGLVQACLSPFTFGMANELNKLRINYKYPGAELKNVPQINNNSSQSSCIEIENSSSPVRTAPSSIDSGHYSEQSEDEEEDANPGFGDTSHFFRNKGMSEREYPLVLSKPKGFVAETDSNTQSSSQVPLAVIEGAGDIRKFINFLKTNRRYTITNIGKFAHVPPTLLSPHQFRLSTPQVPEILLSRNVMGHNGTSRSLSKSGFGLTTKQPATSSTTSSSSNIINNSSSSSNSSKWNCAVGPTSIEITGTVLPSLYKELHNLLVLSENEEHKCQSTTLESSAPFSTIQF